MRKLTFFAGALALILAGACSKSNEGPDGPESVDGKVYMSFSVEVPGVRSSTDESGDTNSDADPDSEVGKDRENTISNVTIFLEPSAGAAIKAQDITLTGSKGAYMASFRSTSLTGGVYNLWVYANAGDNADFDKDKVYNIQDADLTGGPAKANSFLMTSSEVCPVILPDDLSAYSSPANPFNLGTCKVERSVARFDYASVNNDIYSIKSNKEGDNAVLANICLTDAAVFNMSQNFYYLRRVSADGTSKDWTIGGVETPENYVVDTDWNTKSNSAYYYTLNKVDTYSWISLGGLGEDDNYASGDYKIMTYVSENTIAGKNQKKGVTTGVVFKGYIAPAENTDNGLKAVLEAATEPIYVFRNVLYGTWDMVKEAAESDDALTVAVGMVEAEANRTGATYADAGFTGYTPSNGKYEVLYYYYNRHNDNNKPTEMGPMEFATVRNNVYKLSVTSINKFGHPADPDDPDPDPEDPDDPDEEGEYYFSMNVKVLPWVVRINNIEF